MQFKTIKTKLFVVSVTVTLALSSILFSGWQGFLTINQHTQILALLKKESVSLERMLRGLAEFSLSEGSHAPFQLAHEAIADFEDAHQELIRGRGQPELKRSLAEDIQPTWQALRVEILDFLDTEEISPYNMEAMIQYGQIAYAIDELHVQMQHLVQAEEKHTNAVTKRTGMITAILAVLIIALTHMTLRTLYRTIAAPIAEIVTLANRTANGDLTHDLQVQRSDEIGVLASAFSHMTARLKHIIGRVHGVTMDISEVSRIVKNSSSHVATVVGVEKKAIEAAAATIEGMDQSMSDISFSSAHLAETAQRTASSVAELSQSIAAIANQAHSFNETASESASSMTEMTCSVEQVAKSVEYLMQSFIETLACLTEVEQSIKGVEDKVTESGQYAELVSSEAASSGIPAVDAAVEGMKGILHSVTNLAQVINNLDKRSDEIGRVISVIDEIADQTQLLSLNAAILAAQAGKQGSPFSVVATEIKNLADRTTSSTKEVSELISAVQGEARSSVDLVHHGVEAVENGMELVLNTKQAFENMHCSAVASAEMSRSVHDTTGLQALAIREVSEAMTEMSAQVAHIATVTQQQKVGGRIILEAVEKTKLTSEFLLSATVQQSTSCNDLAEVSEGVQAKASSIDAVLADQKQRSHELVSSFEDIKYAVDELVSLVVAMDQSVDSLSTDSETLEKELEEFKV